MRGLLKLSTEEAPRVEDAGDRLDVVDDMVDGCDWLLTEVFGLQSIQRDVAGRRRGPRLVTDLVQYSLLGCCCCCR